MKLKSTPSPIYFYLRKLHFAASMTQQLQIFLHFHLSPVHCSACLLIRHEASAAACKIESYYFTATIASLRHHIRTFKRFATCKTADHLLKQCVAIKILLFDNKSSVIENVCKPIWGDLSKHYLCVLNGSVFEPSTYWNGLYYGLQPLHLLYIGHKFHWYTSC